MLLLCEVLLMYIMLMLINVPYTKSIKFQMNFFNESLIFLYVLLLYYLNTSDQSNFEETLSIGKFIIILAIIQKIGNSVILCLVVANKVKE